LAPLPLCREAPAAAPAPGAFDAVALAASLGGAEALREVLAGLPAWFPAPVLVVQHRLPAAEQLTVDLLRRRIPLAVELARAGDRPRPGVVHVAPADRQLTLAPDGAFRCGPSAGRPGCAADPLFASVAARAGPRALGVILSGTGADGAAGVVALKRAGGRVLVQDRASARCFAMPAAAIATGCVDLVLPVGRLAAALLSLVLWPGAADLLRVPLSPWAALGSEPAPAGAP
jgi:two-component system chemotaxis response regulator CheB